MSFRWPEGQSQTAFIEPTHLKSNDRDLDVFTPKQRPKPFEESTEDGHLSGSAC